MLIVLIKLLPLGIDGGFNVFLCIESKNKNIIAHIPVVADIDYIAFGDAVLV